MKQLSVTILPDLERNLITSRAMAPQDFEGSLFAFRGAAFCLKPMPIQCAWFRLHNRGEELDRFCQVGAGKHPGAGVSSVLLSARVLDAVLPEPARLVQNHD